MSRTLCLVGAVVVAGCGSSSTLGATLSGPYVRTLAVSLSASAGAGGDSVEGPNLIVLFAPADNSSLVLGTNVSIHGNTPATGTFTAANSDAAQAQLAANDAAASVWKQFFLVNDPSQTRGTFTLTLTSAGTLGAAGTGLEGRTPWVDLHGTYTASLPPETGGAIGTEPVTVSISF